MDLLSDLCIRALVRCFTHKPGISSRLTGNDRQVQPMSYISQALRSLLAQCSY